MKWRVFYVLGCHLFIFFRDVSRKAFDRLLIKLFVFLFWGFKCSFSILANSSLLDLSFANIFSWSVGFLLILLTCSFTGQKFFLLLKSSL